MYLYRAVDKGGATVDFLFSPTRNLKDAKRFFRRAYARHGLPVQVTIDGSQTNLEAARKPAFACTRFASLPLQLPAAKPPSMGVAMARLILRWPNMRSMRLRCR